MFFFRLGLVPGSLVAEVRHELLEVAQHLGALVGVVVAGVLEDEGAQPVVKFERLQVVVDLLLQAVRELLEVY